MTLTGVVDVVEVAYALGRAHWGGGIASEAARASLRYGFEQMKLPRIIAVAVPENTGSRRVMEKIGMQFEGMTDQYYRATLALYSIQRADFNPGDEAYRLIRMADR
jgi:ribosomal-protein-alanine N-acetyltransferase